MSFFDTKGKRRAVLLGILKLTGRCPSEVLSKLVEECIAAYGLNSHVVCLTSDGEATIWRTGQLVLDSIVGSNGLSMQFK